MHDKNDPLMADHVRVLIADDHRLFAESLRASLSSDERIEVVGLAYTGEEAVELVAALSPDIVLMDIDMPVVDGIEATRRISESGSATRVLVLTGSDSPLSARRAREAGAAGFVTKDQPTSEMLDSFFEIASLMLAFGRPEPARAG